MKRLLITLFVLLPLCAHAYQDHRGRDLDSLERTISHWTADALEKAGPGERAAYTRTCRQLAWGYLQLDGPRCVYYARRAIQTGRIDHDEEAVFDASILIGQCFWAREQYDSARVYYDQASAALAWKEAHWTDPDRHDLEADQSRLWGTLGNFYAAQDSVAQFVHYYDKAGAIFEKWGWWEDCSTLHRNIGEVYTDSGDLKRARPEYEKALAFAQRSGDSLIIANAMFGMGHWYKASGRTARALKYLARADEYFSNHPKEEPVGRADTLAVMNEAHRQLYRNSRLLTIGAILLLALSAAVLLISRRLKRTRQALTETSAVLDETIEELRPLPQPPDDGIQLTKREKDIVRLMMEGKSAKQIADALCIGYETVLWYRKRLHAKLDVHSAPELVAEVIRRGLL